MDNGGFMLSGFSPRQRMVGLVVLHFFDKFGVEVVLVKGAS